jgi:peptidoglycan/xylan/chitin deacetylase (PgdA/CDA1 family)
MTVLCYHSVQADWTSPLAVQPEDFAAHCAWLADNRRVLPLHEAIDRLDSSGRLPSGLATLTFDDGFTGVYDHAMPVLARHNLPSTVFLVAETLTPAGRAVDWVDTVYGQHLTTLTVEQVLEMQAQGVTFESHSYSHLDLTTLTFQECVRDLRESRELLESLLGHPVRLLAYPRGRHNDTVRVAAAEAGYTHAFTLPEGPEPSGPYSIPRVGLYRGNGVANLRVKSARPYLPVRTGPGYVIAQRARHKLGQLATFRRRR